MELTTYVKYLRDIEVDKWYVHCHYIINLPSVLGAWYENIIRVYIFFALDE